MASNKSKSFSALWAHCSVYCLVFLLVLALVDPEKAAFFAAINFLLHLATDYVTSRINAKLWASGDVHYFFVGIGADQLIHQITLIGTFFWIYL